MAAATAAKVNSPQESMGRLKQVHRVAALMKQLSNPTRLQLALLLSDRECHVGALCEALRRNQPALSHHLALLRLSGIIWHRREGKYNFYSLTEIGEELARVVNRVSD